jgi:endonuclease IV
MKYRLRKKNHAPIADGNMPEKDIMKSLSDPNGSYTGIPSNPSAFMPEQDADDL